MKDEQKIILIVDDEPDMCWVLRHILQQKGYPSRTALTGEEALKFVETEQFSLVFLDAKLPDMEGLDLAVRIREVAPSTSIVIISGYFYRDDIDIQQALGRGLISGFIAKPFEQGEIAKLTDGLRPLTSDIKEGEDLP